jgi:hypothetical protein
MTLSPDFCVGHLKGGRKCTIGLAGCAQGPSVHSSQKIPGGSERGLHGNLPAGKSESSHRSVPEGRLR